MTETIEKKEGKWLHAISSVASLMMGIVLVVGLTMPACFKNVKAGKPMVVAAAHIVGQDAAK